MLLSELREDLAIEFSRLDETLEEIRLIQINETNGALSRSDITAGATYLAQCYSGIENILKRITKYNSVPLPSGSFWHVELIGMFSDGDGRDIRLPLLVDALLFPTLTTLRKFRHTVAHGYAVSFDRETVMQTLPLAERAINQFKHNVQGFIEQMAPN